MNYKLLKISGRFVLACGDSYVSSADTKRDLWFETVEACTNHWCRIDGNTLTLWFSGYITAECYAAENKLRALGGFVLSMEFDRICGKTAVRIREPKDLDLPMNRKEGKE